MTTTGRVRFRPPRGLVVAAYLMWQFSVLAVGVHAWTIMARLGQNAGWIVQFCVSAMISLSPWCFVFSSRDWDSEGRYWTRWSGRLMAVVVHAGYGWLAWSDFTIQHVDHPTVRACALAVFAACGTAIRTTVVPVTASILEGPAEAADA